MYYNYIGELATFNSLHLFGSSSKALMHPFITLKSKGTIIKGAFCYSPTHNQCATILNKPSSHALNQYSLH